MNLAIDARPASGTRFACSTEPANGTITLRLQHPAGPVVAIGLSVEDALDLARHLTAAGESRHSPVAASVEHDIARGAK